MDKFNFAVVKKFELENVNVVPVIVLDISSEYNEESKAKKKHSKKQSWA